jgi:hypothetical protein
MGTRKPGNARARGVPWPAACPSLPDDWQAGVRRAGAKGKQAMNWGWLWLSLSCLVVIGLVGREAFLGKRKK